MSHEVQLGTYIPLDEFHDHQIVQKQTKRLQQLKHNKYK